MSATPSLVSTACRPALTLRSPCARRSPVASDAGLGDSSWSLAAVLLEPRPALTGSVHGGERRAYAPGYTRPLNKFKLDAGQWTDDTSMALCLADSLLKCGALDGSDVRA